MTTGRLDRADAELAGRTVTVVGGGVGGLSAAAVLAEAGADVRLLERHDRLGGHASTIETGGFTFDAGPSWYLMPDVFERFFARFDREPGDYYGLERLDPQYRVFWKDGDRVTVRPDVDDVAATFERYEDGAGDALRRYLDAAERNYELAMEQFVYADRARLRDFLDPELAKLGRAVGLLGTMDDYVAARFEHPKLRQLLQYTLVFLGGAPSNTPALYHIMSHVDLNLGVYYPTAEEGPGGIGAVVDGLADLARERGVRIETGREVTAIRGSAGRFTVETSGGPLASDRVVANANPALVERDLLAGGNRRYGERYWESRTLAPSAFMLYLGVEGDVDPLAHHTLVLPTDWDGHFERIFEDPAWPEDPAYYVSVPSLTDDAVAPDGHHTVVVLVPVAPGLADGPDRRERFREQVLADLAENAVDLRDRIVVERRACVSEFAERFGDPQGTALGLAHTLGQTGPLRPGRRGAVDGLYYAGSFTDPGVGMPMCLISGEHAARAVATDVGGRSALDRVADGLGAGLNRLRRAWYRSRAALE